MFSSTPAVIAHTLHCTAAEVRKSSEASPAAPDAEDDVPWACEWCGCDTQILLRDGHDRTSASPDQTVGCVDAVKEEHHIDLSAKQPSSLEKKIADSKRPGPGGKGTLCTPCGRRYASVGNDGKPWVTETRRGAKKFACRIGCKSSFESVAQLSLHEIVCKGAFSSHWACWWCGCRESSTSCKSPGPDMADQLCLLCYQEYKRGALVPIRRKKGGFKCPRCFRGCPTVAIYHCHRQLCDLVYAAKHPHLNDSYDDLVYFTRKLACAETNGTMGRLACTPPAVATMLDPRVPNWLIPDIISIANAIHSLGPKLSLPHMSVQEIVGVACLDTNRQEHCNKHLLWLADEIHLRLTMLVMELAHVTPLPNGPAYFRYHQKHFANIGPDGLDGAAAVMQRCLDALTWEAILWQYVKYNVCDEYGDERRSASPMVGVVETVGLYGYQHLYVEQRIMLLKFLINEVLGSEYTRKVLLDNANALEEHDRKRREVLEVRRQKEKIFFAQNPGAKKKSALDSSKMSQLEKKRARSVKEAERRKAAKQAKIEAAEAAAGLDTTVGSTLIPVFVKPDNKSNERAKIMYEASGGSQNVAKRAPNKVNPAFGPTPASVLLAAAASKSSAPSKSVSRRASAFAYSRSLNNSIMEAVRACVTAMVQKIVEQDSEGRSLAREIDEEDTMPLRLEPLGEDREYNKYWWTASAPGKLWVETGSRPTEAWPPATRAYAEGAKSTDERIDAAKETILESVKAISTMMLREMAALCGVRSRPDVSLDKGGAKDKLSTEESDDGHDDQYESFTRDELVKHIFAHDRDGTVVTSALEQCEADAARARMAQAPKTQVLELLDLADIKWNPIMTRRELARLPSNAQLRKMLVDVLPDGYPSEDEELHPIILSPPKLIFSPQGSSPNQASPDAYRGPSRQKRRRSKAKSTGHTAPTKVVAAGSTDGTSAAAASSDTIQSSSESPSMKRKASSPIASGIAAHAAGRAVSPAATTVAVQTVPSKPLNDDQTNPKMPLPVNAAPCSPASAPPTNRLLLEPIDKYAQQEMRPAPISTTHQSAVAQTGTSTSVVETALASSRTASENVPHTSTTAVHQLGPQSSKKFKPSGPWLLPIPPVRPESPPSRKFPRTGSAGKNINEPHQKVVSKEHTKQCTAGPKDETAATSPRSPKRSRTHHLSPSPSAKAGSPIVRRTDHASWSGEENAMLRCLVFEHGEGDWVRKHRQLGTCRTPADIEEHWK